MQRTSVWIATVPRTGYASLTEDLTVDVAVIGAGFTGITSALLLKQAGLKVAVVEAERIAEGVSGHTTAKITSQHHLIYRYLVDKFGKDGAQVYADANQHALRQMKSWIAEKEIDCDLREAFAYIFAESEADAEGIRQEVEAAKSLSLPASFTTDTELPFPVKAAVRFDEQAQFHPCKYLEALAQQIDGDGCRVFEHTRAVAIDESDRCTVRTETGSIIAKDVIIATHFPITDHSLFSARLTPMRHYAICASTNGSALEDMYVSSEIPVHSVRMCETPQERLLLVMGEAHRTGEVTDTEACYERLIEYTRSHFGVNDIRYRWSSQDLESIDKVPYIGRFSPTSSHRYTATGFRAWGITHATVAALILADLVQGKENPWQALYAPSRIKPAASVKKFVKHNISAAKHMVVDRLKRKEGLESLAPGEGRLVKIGNKGVAAYKDEGGRLFTVSPTCTHLGCVLSWNNAEKTWDCACHGSRFAPDGKILHGPAVTPLKKVR